MTIWVNLEHVASPFDIYSHTPQMWRLLSTVMEQECKNSKIHKFDLEFEGQIYWPFGCELLG